MGGMNKYYKNNILHLKIHYSYTRWGVTYLSTIMYIYEICRYIS